MEIELLETNKFSKSFFDEFEIEILETAVKTIKNRILTLTSFMRYKLAEKGLGIEGWFTIELITNIQFQNWGIKKVQSPAELIIRDKSIEVKGLPDTNFMLIHE